MLPDLTGYGWNEESQRYIDLDTGRFVSASAVREALESVIDASAVTMNNLSEQLANGEISLAAWQSSMMEQIKVTHVAAGASAGGGWAQMTPSDWGAVGQEVRQQYDYLRNFASQIASGEQPLDGRFMVRSDMYSDAARGTFEDIRFRAMEEMGAEEEIRILEQGGEPCDGCIEQAGMGWVELGELEPIGSQECGPRCRCEKKFRKMTESGEWEEFE